MHNKVYSLSTEEIATLKVKKYNDEDIFPNYNFRDELHSSLMLETIPEKPPLLKRIFNKEAKIEFKALFTIAIPVVITNLLQFTILTESIILCGHLTAIDLEAAGLANSMINALGLSINVGICTACDTLFSQSFGSSNRKRTGLFLQRGLMIITHVPFLLGIIYMNMEPLLILMGQDPEVSRLAAQFMQYFIPGLLAHSHYMTLLRYMQSQQNVYPPIFITLGANVFNIVTQYIALYQMNLGLQASAICQSVTYVVLWLSGLLYIRISGFYKATWDGWKAEALFDWRNFVNLAIFGVGHVTLEIVCFEACTILAGLLGTVQLAAQSILFQCETILFMIPLGIGMACNIRIGQCLGGQNPDGAKVAFRIGIIIGACSALVFASLILSLKSVLPMVFTNDPKIVNYTQEVIPIIALVLVVDHAMGISAGILRGCGRQALGALIIFCAYEVTGFPIGVILTFVANLGVIGLWTGIAVGLLGGSFMNWTFIFRQDWEIQAKKAQERIRGRFAADTETTPLLGGDKVDSEYDFGAHRRTPSQPYGCSIDMPRLPEEKTFIEPNKFRTMLLVRIFCFLVVIAAFLTAVLCHFFIPYQPHSNQKNSTLILNTTSF